MQFKQIWITISVIHSLNFFYGKKVPSGDLGVCENFKSPSLIIKNICAINESSNGERGVWGELSLRFMMYVWQINLSPRVSLRKLKFDHARTPVNQRPAKR